MSEDLIAPWSDLLRIDGCLPVRWCIKSTHALDFEFYDPCEDIEDGWNLRGSVKWDGCMNWETSPDVMYHFCGIDSIKLLATTFLLIREITKQNLPTADAELFE